MKITKIEAWEVRMDLREHYVIAYKTITSAENVFLRIETDRGITGFGCASPDFEVTGETMEKSLKACDDVVKDVLVGADPLMLSNHLNRLEELLPGQPSVRALVDMALHDILGKTANLPVYKLLGAFRGRIKTTMTIGIMTVEDTVKKALEFIKQGFKALKVKGGKNVDDDVEKIIKIREAVGKDIEIRFDANQGYGLDEAVRFFNGTRNAGVELMEQPTPSKDLELLKNVTTTVDIPVMADECVLNLADAFMVAKSGAANMLNIKLMKCGGIHGALHINSVARAADMKVMVGCMDEAALSIAAGLHFTLARPNVQYADLDGHLILKDDPSAGTVTLKDGFLYPSERPGLGADPAMFRTRTDRT